MSARGPPGPPITGFAGLKKSSRGCSIFGFDSDAADLSDAFVGPDTVEPAGFGAGCDVLPGPPGGTCCMGGVWASGCALATSANIQNTPATIATLLTSLRIAAIISCGRRGYHVGGG